MFLSVAPSFKSGHAIPHAGLTRNACLYCYFPDPPLFSSVYVPVTATHERLNTLLLLQSGREPATSNTWKFSIHIPTYVHGRTFIDLILHSSVVVPGSMMKKGQMVLASFGSLCHLDSTRPPPSLAATQFCQATYQHTISRFSPNKLHTCVLTVCPVNLLFPLCICTRSLPVSLAFLFNLLYLYRYVK